jgi:hypothetical protein
LVHIYLLLRISYHILVYFWLFATFPVCTLVMLAVALICTVLTALSVLIRQLVWVLNLLELAAPCLDNRLWALATGLNGGNFGTVRSNLILTFCVVYDHVYTLASQCARLFVLCQRSGLFTHSDLAVTATLVQDGLPLIAMSLDFSE